MNVGCTTRLFFNCCHLRYPEEIPILETTPQTDQLMAKASMMETKAGLITTAPGKPFVFNVGAASGWLDGEDHGPETTHA